MKKRANPILMAVIYITCIILTILSIYPFLVMFVNATRNSAQVQSNPISLIPSKYLFYNLKVFEGKSFDPMKGLMNSFVISASSTILTIYFSTLTAFAIVAYNWKLRNAFYTFILAVMMLPAQVTAIGFYQLMYKLGLTNNLLALILPAIAAPATVFFMRQFMIPALPMEIVQSARVDGAGEFRTFNQIVLPIMKPAMATQAIFSFVASWNNLFMPSILLTDTDKYTMPVMVSLLKGDIYKTEFGTVYLGLAITVLPLFIIYFLLSKYIIAGVALGGVKG
ncbi:MAG: carbohydrate ABC transporter permease [Ruminococcaceae bacterium]|nr:carbohydrate ABC transporter permease [Oscillospiraceae bacterium]